MEETLYIHYSDILSTPVFTDRGYLCCQGYHALGGLRVSLISFNSETPTNLPSPLEWLAKLARFWSALSIGVNTTGNSYQTSFELRLHRNPKTDYPVDATLWVKTFARDDLMAALEVEHLVDTISLMYPAPARLSLIQTKDEFFHLWGNQDLPWLVEIRRPSLSRTVHQLHNEMPANPRFGEWAPSIAGWRETWELFSKLPGDIWMSIGVCPTLLFACEGGVFQEKEDIDEDTEIAQYWRWKKHQLLTSAFFIKIRIGGDMHPVQVLARYAASALTDSQAEDQISDQAQWFPVQAAEITTPGSILEWDHARFNWNWGDFQEWGYGVDELAFPYHLLRIPYLCNVRETALLAGVWM